MEKVLVIGSNSFSGSHMVKTLIGLGYDVVGISRSEEIKPLYRPYGGGRFSFRQLDLNKNATEIADLVFSERFPYIINFASQSMVGESWQHPEHWYQTNTVGTVKLINSLKGLDFLKKYVHISTPEVYGSTSGIVREDAPFNPSTPYAASRAAGDTFVEMMIKQYGFPAVFTRAANVYGPGQQLFKIIPRSFVFARQGIKIPLHGGGNAKRSFIHISDVCRATEKIMVDAKPGQIYHLSTDQLTRIKDLVRMICGRVGVEFDGAVDMSQTRIGLDDAYILDSSKAKNDFNWKADISLEMGLEEVAKWIEDNWDEISQEPLQYIHKE